MKKKEIAIDFCFGVSETLWSIFVHQSSISLRKWKFEEEVHKLLIKTGVPLSSNCSWGRVHVAGQLSC
jgi:hypothetical protein